MTILATFLSRSGISQRAFAAIIGVDLSIVSRLTRGEMTPTLRLAMVIEDARNGDIPARYWINLTDRNMQDAPACQERQLSGKDTVLSDSRKMQ